MISYRKILEGLDKFFFEERPTEGIALFRIVWMGMLLIYFVSDLGNISDFYGPHALISIDTARQKFTGIHGGLFFLFNTSYEFTYLVIGVYGLALLFSMIGFFTRYSLITALICMVSIHQRNIWLLSSSETLMRLIMIYLVVSPCGNTLSVDALLGRRYPQFKREKESSVWALRLIQIQFSVVYLWTVWHKLKGEAWLDGSAVYYATRLENMANFSIPYLLDNKWILSFLTWFTLLIEISLGLLVWVKEFRKPVIIAGLIFHVGIEYVMCVPFFEINMMIIMLNFISPEEVRDSIQKNMSALVAEIQESTVLVGFKSKIISALRG